MESFLKLAALDRVKKNNLLKINEIIDWQQQRLVLKKIDRSGLGPTGYDTLGLLKALILQAWYELSDYQLEESLRVRMDFMLFTGFDDDVPDHSTLCRFRNLLISRGILEKSLNNINKQLERKGLKVEAKEGAIIDATVIESAARPEKVLEAAAADRDEENPKYVVENTSYSKDKDARWLKKGGKSYFGYKVFAVVDAKRGYIEKVHTTPANASECRAFPDVVSDMETKRMYADKGYASAENREYLQKNGVKSAIMHVARRNKTLGYWQKVFNRLVSKVRFRVEQAFGTLKRRFSFTRARYFGLAKVQGQCLLKSIAFNLLKAVNMT
jgi:IS5 family transposase